jgi:N-acetylglucosaminyl-diphospho-decaprenol L-rhamnosyltransferase
MMAQPPDISVVIVSWNTRELLLRCLGSLSDDAGASGLSIEVLVVDNASNDGTPDAVREHEPGTRLIEMPENRGFATATNAGMRQATGAAILVLNPDSELEPGAMRALWNTLHASPRVGLVGPLLLNSDGSFQSAGYRFPGLRQIFFDLFPLHPRLVGSGLNGRFPIGDGRTPFAIDHPLGACMLVRREVIDQVGMLDEVFFLYSEEIDWCRRIKDAGWLILTAPLARVVHHGGQSTRQTPRRMYEQLHRSRGIYFRRYHSRHLLRAARALMSLAAWLRQRRVPVPGLTRPPDDYRHIRAFYELDEPGHA